MDKGGEYSLKWNSHKSTVMSAFTGLFESERHADCTLAAEGQVIKVHKVMISACSPYLERLLEDYSKDKGSHPIVIFNDMSYFELKALCEYMYKGEVNVPMENLESFLKIAKCMQVRGLCDGGGGDSIGGLDSGKPGPGLMSKVSSQQQQQVDKRSKAVGSQLLASPSGSDKQSQHHHPHHQPAKRKRLDQAAFDSDNSTDNVAYISSPRGGRGGKAVVKQQGGKVVGTCSPRVVQEVKADLTTVKTEEPEPVYEETVYQDLTFEEEIFPDAPVVASEQVSASNNDSALEFGNWNDGNSNDFNQDSANQEQVKRMRKSGGGVKRRGKAAVRRRGRAVQPGAKETAGAGAAARAKSATPPEEENGDARLVQVKAGTYVLVEFFGGRKCATRYRYAAVCQGGVDKDSEVEVMSLKTRGNDNVLFKQDDNDVCFVRYDQIIEVLPEPAIVMQGNRVLYKFPRRVNVMESN